MAAATAAAREAVGRAAAGAAAEGAAAGAAAEGARACRFGAILSVARLLEGDDRAHVSLRAPCARRARGRVDGKPQPVESGEATHFVTV